MEKGKITDHLSLEFIDPVLQQSWHFLCGFVGGGETHVTQHKILGKLDSSGSSRETSFSRLLIVNKSKFRVVSVVLPAVAKGLTSKIDFPPP